MVAATGVGLAEALGLAEGDGDVSGDGVGEVSGDGVGDAVAACRLKVAHGFGCTLAQSL
jgi:hypothetical protein